MPFYTSIKILAKLNEQLESWIEEYNRHHVHKTIKTTPYKKFKKNLECVRPAPPNLLDYFRVIDFRMVKSDRTFQLNGLRYEGPVKLIKKKIELRYHEEATEKVEVFFNNQSFGFAELVDPHLNASVGRNWRKSVGRKKEEKVLEDKKITTGQLFSGENNEQV